MDSGSDGGDGDDFYVGHERLEENEELRLHILGMQSYWTQHLNLQKCSLMSVQKRTSK